MKERIRKIILFVCVCVFLYSAFQLGKIYYDYYMIEKESEQLIEDYVTVTDVNDPINRKVDFTKLQKQNKDVIGWIYIPDTTIDEPILKGANNDTYLRTGINRKYNVAGCVFIDEINSKDLNDDNTIIYGHNMKNGSRFHDLRYFIKQDYFSSHPKTYIYLPDGSVNVYQNYASASMNAESELYAKGIDYSQYTKQVIQESSVHTDVDSTQQPLIMLSTCQNSVGESLDRYVLFARLDKNIKR